MEPKEIKGSRMRAGLFAVVGLGLAGFSAYFFSVPAPTTREQVLAWMGTPMFSLAGLYGLFRVLNPPVLKLTAKGFAFTGLIGEPRFVAWDHVEPLYVWSVRRTPSVVFKYFDDKRPSDWRLLINRPFGFDGDLPKTFPMGHEKLAQLMNEYRLDALKTASFANATRD